MLIITAVFPGEMLSDLAFHIAQLIKKKRNKRIVKGASIWRGAQTEERQQE